MRARMTCQRRVFAAFSVAALTTVSGAMAATPTYYAKEIVGATFVEEAKWNTTGPASGESDTGSGKYTLIASATQPVQLMVITGAVTVVSEPHGAITSTVTSTFQAEGTHTQDGAPDSNDHGTMQFSGSTGTAHGDVVNDFDLNGDNLSWSIGGSGVMTGKCQDDKFGDKCNENTAGPGVPEVAAGGNAPPSFNTASHSGAGGWVMQVGSGAGFYAGHSSQPAGATANLPILGPFPGTCHGSIQTGYTCAFAGTKVWNKAPGVTYTVRVQANARIVITGKK
jgi:hypothetical protein